jgi:hypothetical protein
MDFNKLSTLLCNTVYPKPSSGNQRAYADLIEEKASALARTHYPNEFVPARTVRSPEDFVLDLDTTYLIDVKTRQLNTEFNMPNLISVDRLDRILSDQTKDLYYWLIDYSVNDQGECSISHSTIRAIWTMPWSALAIQNLGKGQLQIKDWTAMDQQYAGSRETWLGDLRIQRRQFYLKQAQKFQKMAEKIRV